MFSLLRALGILILISISLNVKSQDKRVIELILPFPIAYDLNDKTINEGAIYAPVAINYIYNRKLSAGLNIVGSILFIPVESFVYTRSDENSPYLLSQVGDEEAERFVTGIGVNTKYNFITHQSLNAYVQVDANYLNIGLWYQTSAADNDGISNDQVMKDENGEFVPYDHKGPPVTEQTTMNFNISAGIDIKINRRFAFYLQYQLFDIFKSIGLSYKEEAYYTNDPDQISGDDQYLDKVIYSESELAYNKIRYIQGGFRVYFGSKKL